MVHRTYHQRLAHHIKNEPTSASDSPMKTQASNQSISTFMPSDIKTELGNLFFIGSTLVVFVECEVQPFDGCLIFEMLKLGFVFMILSKKMTGILFKCVSGMAIAIYINFRMVTQELWFENCSFLFFFMVLGLIFYFRSIFGTEELKTFTRHRLIKNHAKSLSFQNQLSLKNPEGLNIPWNTLEKLLNKTDRCFAILDSSLKAIYSTLSFERLMKTRPLFYSSFVKVIKVKSMKSSTLSQKIPSIPLSEAPTLEETLKSLVSSNSEANLFVKMLETPNGTANTCYVFRYWENKRPFLAILMISQTDNLEAVIENQSKILSYVSHEFRTPLNCINGMLQCLEEQVPVSAYETYIQPALSSGKYLMNMLQDILDMTQIKAGKFKLNYLDFDMNMLLKDIFSLFQVQAKTKKINLTFQISPKVPNILQSDPNRLKQVVINLVSNAFKYTQKGEINLYCDLVNKDPRIIRVSVKDTGLGIRDCDKPRLLHAFGRIENDKNKELNPQGIGLGLIISQEISKTLAAELTDIPDSEKGLHFESEYLKGSVFTFVFENLKGQEQMEGIVKTEPENEFESEEYGQNPVAKYSNLKKYEKAKKFLSQNENESEQQKDCTPFFPKLQSKSSLNIKFVKSKKPSLSLTHAPTIKEIKEIKDIVCQLSFVKEDVIPQYHSLKKNSISITESKIFRNFSQIGIRNLVPEVKILSPEKMSVLSDMSISFTSNSRSISNISKLQEIKTRLEFVQKKCPCPDVLIVDDDSYNILALQFLIESLNLSSENASSAQEAIMKIKDLNEVKEGGCCRYFKVVFMDIEMPGMNGLDACREIKEFLKAVGGLEESKLIACTGYNDQETNQKIKEAGFDSQLVKPILKGTLIGVLADYLLGQKSNNTN